MIAPTLPATLAPPAPFPLVVAQSSTQAIVAPGVRRVSYRLETSAGPLAIEAVVVDPHEPSLRLGAVLANDRLVSNGETVSSMARRTHAVAGVNADYFDIGQTNQPLNVVVRDGALVRTPSKRIALDVRRDRSVRFETFAFRGDVAYDGAHVPLTAIDEWPPQGGATLLGPEFGTLRAAPGVTIASLAPIDASPASASSNATYRVTALADAGVAAPSSLALGFGPAARAIAPPPAIGDVVTVARALVPDASDIVTAVGGGPLLVANGAIASDPNAPAPEERDVRFPVSGAALLPSGALVLVEVDGRDVARSIGLTRPEFAALALGLGATDAMAFDSGGSAELVARELGDAGASLANVPSDGEERRVADGLFVYSDAPVGPPVALAIRPANVVALANVDVPVRAFVVDAFGHTLAPTHLDGGDVVRVGDASGDAIVRAGGRTARVAVRVASAPDRFAIRSDAPSAMPGASVTLRAVATDASGAPIELGDRVRWSADRGIFLAPGRFRAPARDARIVARVGAARAEYRLLVGERRIALDLFDASHAAAWRYSANPAGAAGSAIVGDAPPHLDLAYDFTNGARAAYANASLVLPGMPERFAIDVTGDGSGVGLRAAFVNVLGERRALTLAKIVDWTGTRRLEIPIPDDLNPPIRLVALYAVPSLGGTTAAAVAGTISFARPSVVVAGTP